MQSPGMAGDDGGAVGADGGRPSMRYVFGVDLGGTTVKLGAFDAAGGLLEKCEIPTRSEGRGAQILPDIAGAVRGWLAGRRADIADVDGVGVGVPGAVVGDGYVAPCVNLDQWGGFDVAVALSDLLDGVTVRVVNDANAAALGEMAAGGAEGCENVLFVTLGTGVGGGIVVGGRLLAGPHGAGGEIGHVKVTDDEQARCGCGKYGCLEQYASATGVVKAAHRALAGFEGTTILRGRADLTCRDVFDAAKLGDALARSVVDETCRVLGRALASIACVCDPEVIVIGGGVARAGDILLEGVRKAFVAHAFPACEKTLIVLAQLGNDAGMYGAARLVSRA